MVGRNNKEPDDTGSRCSGVVVIDVIEQYGRSLMRAKHYSAVKIQANRHELRSIR